MPAAIICTRNSAASGLPFPSTRYRRHARGRAAVWLLAVALLAAGGGLWYLRRHAAPAPDEAGADSGSAGLGKHRGHKGEGHGFDPNRPTPVRAVAAQARDVDLLIDALGTATALNTVTVRVRVDGQLQRVLFNEGQLVKAGELLALIDPRPFEVALAQAQGQLAKDQAQLTNARLDLQRYADLVKQDAAPRQQLDGQQALVHQLEGALKADQAAVDNAKLQLDYTRVAAPLGGRVGLRQVDAGNMVHTADANGLATITQVQPMVVVFAIPQDALPKVLAAQRASKPGQALTVQALDRAGSQVLARGALASIDNQIDPATGTVKLKAQFANADGALFPNQFVNVKLRVDQLTQVPTVPEPAIQRGAQGSFVYVVKADRSVSVRPVKIGPRQEGRVAITDGLQAGEQVVVDGSDKLREGAKVEVVVNDGHADGGKDGRRVGFSPRSSASHPLHQ